MKNTFGQMASETEERLEEPAESSEPQAKESLPTDSQSAEIAAIEESSSTPADVKEITQELLKFGYLEEASKPVLFRRAIVREHAIKTALEPLDLALQLDTHRGVAFLKVAATAYRESGEGGVNENSSAGKNTAENGSWTHPLVRRQRLNLEQSLLIAILRQRFLEHEQNSGVGHSSATIPVDELLPQFLTFFDDSGSDTKNESRLAHLLDQLKTYWIVSEIDKNQEVTIRPLIAHLANPESLTALLQAYSEHTQAGSAAESNGMLARDES